MALRLIHVHLPDREDIDTDELLKDHPIIDRWNERLSDNHTRLSILLNVEDTEAILNKVEKYFSGRDGFRVTLYQVEATIPRPEQAPENGEEQKPSETASPNHQKVGRISREELYSDIVDTARLTQVFLVMVMLSTVVAAIGILRDNVTIIIGSMVIAPLLGPNVALSLATTLADAKLAWNAFKTNIAGILVALFLAVSVGFFFPVDPAIPEIATRTRPGFGDIILSLASGAAGALAFTTGLPSALVGVMVAVALLPPLAVFGILVGSGYFTQAFGALLLLLINIICVNLAGVITFLVQGVRPLSWWEKKNAKKATRNAIIVWALLLAALAGMIWYSQ